MPVELEVTDARRIAVRAQLLDADRPQGLVPLVERLSLLQLDPTAAVAPSADLVAWSRIGNTYRPSQLEAAVRTRDLFELDAFVRPMSQLPAVLGSLAGWPSARSCGSGRPASCGREARSFPASPIRPITPECRPSSGAFPVSGGWIPNSSTGRSPEGPHCCHRSTGSSTTASGLSSFSASSTSWRCTSPLPSAGGATTRNSRPSPHGCALSARLD